jgi:hypothetical protein
LKKILTPAKLLLRQYIERQNSLARILEFLQSNRNTFLKPVTMNMDSRDCLLMLALAGFAVTSIPSVMAAKKCLKDETVPEYPVNVYYCGEGQDEFHCCSKDGVWTCCEPSSITSWKNQLIIFGVCIGFIVLVLIIWRCYRSDTYLCVGDQPMLVRCAPCCGAICYEDKKYSSNEGVVPQTRIISPTSDWERMSEKSAAHTDVHEGKKYPPGPVSKGDMWNQSNNLFYAGAQDIDTSHRANLINNHIGM